MSDTAAGKPSLRSQWFLLFISGLAGVLYGVASGNLLSVAMPYFERTISYDVTLFGVAWDAAKLMGTLVSACSLAALFSGFAAGPLAEWIGRRVILTWSAAIYIAATAVVAFCCNNYWILFAGLCLQGLAMGLVGTVAPLYLAESLPAEHRGKGTGLFQLFLIGGIVLSGLIGLLVTYLFGAGDDETTTVAAKTLACQAIFWIGAIPCVVLLFGSLKIPESPEWLKMRGARKKEAVAQTAAAPLEPLTFGTLMTRQYVFPFVVVFLILSCNKLCGLPCILCYSVKLFNLSGLAKEYANWADVAFKTVMFVMTLLACVLVDVKGRKFLLKLGTGTIFFSTVLISGVFFAIERGVVPAGGLTGLLVAIGVVVFIAGYSVGPGVCVWLVMTELLPNRIRAVGMGVVLFVNHFVSMGMQWAFLPAGESFGYGGVWAFCAVSAVLYWAVSAFGMPETKGKSFEEIEAWYKGR